MDVRTSRARESVFGDLSQQKVSAAPPSPFTPLESVYKDGDGSLLFDLKNHVHYSQHYVEPSKYIDFGVALNENAMWVEKFATRFSSGPSTNRFRAFVKMNSAAMNSFYAGLSIRGELVNTWSTQYDDKTGKLDLHSDKFSYCQQARSIFTQGSSRCGKYIRFQERGKGRWVELWLPHGSLYTLDKHGSGADVLRDENGHPVKESIANAEGVPIVQHAIFGAQRTNASFLEWRPQKGSSFDQVLGDLHGALPASPVVNCYVRPPLPTKSQVGQEGCVEMSRSAKAKFANFVKNGVWGLETSYDVQIEYEEEGLYSDYHPDAPPGMSSDSEVYCSFCDTSFLFGKTRHKVQRHCNSKHHKECKEYGSRAEYDRQIYLKAKEKAVARVRSDGIEMGDEDYTCYCSVCDRNFNCASKTTLRKSSHCETRKVTLATSTITCHINTRSHLDMLHK